MRVLSAALLVCLMPRLAFAADPTPPVTPAPLTAVPPGEDHITAVKKGDVAPYDGQLFDQATSIRWANYLQQAHSRLQLDPLYQYKLDQVDLTVCQKSNEMEKVEYDRVTLDLTNQTIAAEKRASNPPFYQTFWFGTVVGVVASVALVGGTAALVNAVKK